MNDVTSFEDIDDLSPESLRPEDELRLLKDRARALGIPVSGNIGIDKLRQKINDKMTGAAEEVEEPVEAAAPVRARPKTKAEIEQELRDSLYRSAMALVRCRIYNLNPGKRDLQGEIITVANRYIGTVRKFIPFGEATDNGYHIPQIIYDDLKSRQFQQIKTRRVNGQILVDTRLVPEYSIEILPQLTPDELQELAMKQAAAERLGSE